MSEALIVVLSLVAGVFLGTLFFGGLWWTIRQGLTSTQPALWFSGSLALRFAVALSGFYWIGKDHYERLLLCLIGFTLTGFAISRSTKIITDVKLRENRVGANPGIQQIEPKQECSHAH